MAAVAAILPLTIGGAGVLSSVVTGGTLAAGRTSLANGFGMDVTALEFALINALAARPGIVFSRDAIMDSAYAANVHVSDRTIDSHVRNIRTKFAAAGCASAIDTVHGVGFRLGAMIPD